jgi:hypothetical protein
MKNVFPFTTGSEVTASFAISSAVSLNARAASDAQFTQTSSIILEPVQGPPGNGICLVTFEQYEQMLSGTFVEDCLPEE